MSAGHRQPGAPAPPPASVAMRVVLQLDGEAGDGPAGRGGSGGGSGGGAQRAMPPLLGRPFLVELRFSVQHGTGGGKKAFLKASLAGPELQRAVLGLKRVGLRRLDAGTVALVVARPPGYRPPRPPPVRAAGVKTGACWGVCHHNAVHSMHSMPGGSPHARSQSPFPKLPEPCLQGCLMTHRMPLCHLCIAPRPPPAPPPGSCTAARPHTPSGQPTPHPLYPLPNPKPAYRRAGSRIHHRRSRWGTSWAAARAAAAGGAAACWHPGGAYRGRRGASAAGAGARGCAGPRPGWRNRAGRPGAEGPGAGRQPGAGPRACACLAGPAAGGALPGGALPSPASLSGRA